jgi:hypothetical protein
VRSCFGSLCFGAGVTPQAKYPETCKTNGVGSGISELVAGMKLKLKEDAEAQDEMWRAKDCRHAWRLDEFYVEATDKVGRQKITPYNVLKHANLLCAASVC